MILRDLLESAEVNYIEDRARDLGIRISVTEGKVIVIHMLRAMEQGTGAGSILMKYICSYADKEGKPIYLTPEKIAGTTSVRRLVDFYKRFGFVVNKGKQKDYSISYGMYRMPNQ